MTWDDLQQRFPDLRPIQSAPALFRFNGCGVSLFGARARDAETGTYLKTWCICLLFVPLIALRSFRVADADGGGWHIVGREPLSKFARYWNLGLLACFGIWIGASRWSAYQESPSRSAAREIARADEHAANGELARAAERYRDAWKFATPRATEARERFAAVIGTALDAAPAAEVARVIALAFEPASRGLSGLSDTELVERALHAAKRVSSTDAAGALAIAEALTAARPDSKEANNFLERALSELLARDPTDVKTASRLSEIAEAREDWAECERLLAPHAERLGELEGARVLGQLRARQGQAEESLRLLGPYAKQRLERFRAANLAFAKALETAWQRELDALEAGRGPRSFYQAYERAKTESEQRSIVDEYVVPLARDATAVKHAEAELVASAKVVPVVLDLAVVRIARARSLTDSDARHVELRAAEDDLLLIRSIAGDSDAYRLNMGEVLHWLGKQEEGRRVFDELLEAHQREPNVVLAVAEKLRDLGADESARALAEEAHAKSRDEAVQDRAARMRAVMASNIEDRIAWLERASGVDSAMRAALSSAKGDRAAQAGRISEAVEFYREAIALYDGRPDDAVTLNNCALARFALARISGDRAEFERGLAEMDRMVALDPSNAIGLGNVATVVLQNALYGVIEERVDLDALHTTPDLETLALLYDRKADRSGVIERLRNDPGVARALVYLERGVVLRPKSAESYSVLAQYYGFVKDTEALRRLVTGIRASELDLSSERSEADAYFSGQRDEIAREALTARLQRAHADLATLAATDAETAATRALGVSLIVGSELGLAALEESLASTDVDALVDLAQQAYERWPSRAGRHACLGALSARLERECAASSAEYAELRRGTQRRLTAFTRLALAIQRPGPLRDAVTSRDDARRIAELLTLELAALEDGLTDSAWAFVQVVDPPTAAHATELLRADESARLVLDIERQLAPLTTSGAVEAYWTHLALGDEPGARAVLDNAVARGVPVPVERL